MNISPIATVIALLFPATQLVGQENSTDQTQQSVMARGLKNHSCSLVDAYFDADMVKIEIYDCLENGFSHPANRTSMRLTYYDEIVIVSPLPKLGEAPAIVSKST